MRKVLLGGACLLLTALPAMAQDVKQEVEKIRVTYQDCIARHDPACIAALYTKSGIQVYPGGEVITDVKAQYAENFKNGEEKAEIKADNVWPLSNDTAMAKGTADLTFNVEPTKRSIWWTGFYVREGGQLKIQMLTVAVAPPPPPKEASAEKK